MKNKYEVRGNITVIFLNYKGKTTTTTISTEDLERVSSIAGSWYAMDVGGKRGEKVYAGTKIGGVTIYMHQIIANNPPKTVVDHTNHESLDNTRENLRIVTHAENGQNRKGAQRNNVNSGFRNVYKSHNDSWYVRLTKNGKSIHIGTFKCIEEAKKRAVEARKKHFGIA